MRGIYYHTLYKSMSLSSFVTHSCIQLINIRYHQPTSRTYEEKTTSTKLRNRVGAASGDGIVMIAAT